MSYIASPMTDWTGSRDPLPTEISPDGKSLVNTPGPRSSTYDAFPVGFKENKNGFDFHIYYNAHVKGELEFARELHERIRREFPELRIYKFWEKPVGPHPVSMFEVNVFDPAQTGALFTFLALRRGKLSVLIHPNTGDDLGDHTHRATWMGQPYPLILDFLRPTPLAA
ncbi:DOPA-like domain-containing protein [Auriculariales sp. MPI-PUGE-AT-0066]|nr:DOPA-like domain-containing protein [Auriculariales sp. MPI-PUGE-AT-0066]